MFNVSSAFQTAIKQNTRTVKASVGIGNKAVTNMVTNGDFSNGLTNWLNSNTTNTVVNGELNSLSNIASGYAYQLITTVVGRKYYIRAKVKANSNQVQFGFSGVTRTPHSGSNNYEYLSSITTATGTNTNIILQDTRTSGWTTMYMDEVIYIDLTTLYGSGNEPSQSFMDELIAKVGWFNGTKNVPLQFVDNRVLNNLATNGNFEIDSNADGLADNWTYANSSTPVLDNTVKVSGSYSQKMNCTANSDCGVFRDYTIPNGNKVYLRGNVRVDIPAQASGMEFYTCDTSFAGRTAITNTIAPSSTFTSMSNVITWDASKPRVLLGIYCTNFTGQSYNVDDIIVIDLTAMYGLNKEPSASYMDNLINTYGWFNSRQFIPSETGESTIIGNFAIESSFGNGDLPTIGATVSNKLSLTLVNDSRIPQVIINTPIRPYVAIDIGSGVYEWVKMGEFYTTNSDVEITKLETSLEAFDDMAGYDQYKYTTSLTLPLKVEDVKTDLARYGVTFANQPTNLVDFNNVYAYVPSKTQLVSKQNGGFTAYCITANDFIGYNVPTVVGQTYTISCTKNMASMIYVYSDNLWGTAIVSANTSNSFSFVATSTLSKIGFYIQTVHTSSSPLIISNIQIETGNTVTSYKQYLNSNLSVIPSGTVRQVISQLAGLMTTNATIDENGDVKFVFLTSSGFSMDKTNYSNFKLKPDAQIKISQLQVKTDKDSIIVGDGSGYKLQFENPQIVDSAGLTTVYNRAFSSYLYYYAYTMTAQGQPHLQIGDTISFTYLKLDGSTTTITIPILNHKFIFNGGMSSEFKASAPKEDTTVITVTGGSTMEKAITQSSNNLLDAMDTSMKIITGNQGGYVVTILDANGKPKELVISDNIDINNTGANVWVWNSGGLVFNTGGYKSTNPANYKVALTSDGKINATMMTTGNLIADIIKGGTLTLGGVNNGNGSEVIKDSSGNNIITMDNNGILITGGKFKIQNRIDAGVYQLGGSEGMGDWLDLVPTSVFGLKTNTSATGISGVPVYDTFTIDNKGIWSGEYLGNSPSFQSSKKVTQFKRWDSNSSLVLGNSQVQTLTTAIAVLTSTDGIAIDGGSAMNVNNPSIRITGASKLEFPRGISMPSSVGDLYETVSTVQPNSMLRLSNAIGYMDIGVGNTSYAQFYTDRAKFYFDKRMYENQGYNFTTSNTGLDSAGLSLSSNGNVYIEMRSENNNMGYMDWSKSGVEDYNVRLQNDISGTLRVVGNLLVSGSITGSSKSAVTTTPTYGEVITYCDESPNHIFVDRGYGVTDENGICYVILDPILLETVNTSTKDYWVHLTSFEEGDVKLRELDEKHFIVKGTPNTRFIWRVDVERFGYEKLRWNDANIQF